MRALTIVPGTPGSARLDDVDEPPLADGAVLADTLAIGVCGTDVDLIRGHYGAPPPGRVRLVIGHESLARVREAPPGCGVVRGDLIVGIVRRPDPLPCTSCAVGEWDMCRNERYTERGIKQRDGYCSDRYRIEPAFIMKIDAALGDLGVLLEPTSVVAKAWEQVDRIGARSAAWCPTRALVIGAGPIGLLAALLGRQRGLEVHVLDRVEAGPKPDLVRDLGATYHNSAVADAGPVPDVVMECTGAPQVMLDVIGRVAPAGIVCLTGVSATGTRLPIDVGALARRMVLENVVVVGSVNANRRHYDLATRALATADRAWLGRLITRRVPLTEWAEALERRPDDVKAIIDVTQ